MIELRIRKTGMSPMQQAEFETCCAQIAQQQADIDYLSMMTDVEIPTEVQEVNEHADEVQQG